ncbi:putative MFS-type transporter C18.02 [Exophiala dermatitidis]
MGVWKQRDALLDRIIPFRGQRPICLEFRSSKVFILFAVCWSVFTDIFLYGVIVPVVPFALQDRVHVSHHDTQHWVSVLLAVYAAALLFFAPIFGWVADRTHSRRTPLLLGLIVLAGSTLMLCLGRTIPILVVGRLLQGASASVVWTVALALLADTVKEEEAGQAIGYVSMATSLGVLVAPLIGGVVYQRAGYYAVFGVTFAIIGFDILLRLALIEKKIAAKWLEPQSPARRSSQATPGTGTDIPLENRAQATDSTAVGEKEETSRAAAAEENSGPRRKKRKLPPLLILLKSRRILAAFWGNLVGSMTFTAIDTTLPLYVNQIFGWDALGAGLVFIALLAPSFAGPIIGVWTDKYGPRWIAASGLLLCVPFWVLLRLVDHDTTGQAVLLCALLVLLGSATALLLTSLMAEFSKVCDAKVRQDPDLFAGKSAYGQSYGIFNVAWAGGSLIGPLVSGAVRSAAGWKTMTWTMAIWCAVGIPPIILYSGGMITKRKRQPNHVDNGNQGGVLEVVSA